MKIIHIINYIGGKNMKKIVKIILSSVLVCSLAILTRVHDEDCGYDSETGSGCVYEISPLGIIGPGEGDSKK